MGDYSRAEVRSADGTVIGFREYGEGTPLILVHGGMKAAQHFHALATALGDGFRVCVPDRRGRGRSGPHGADYRIQREVEDLQALLAATGARRVFGLSAGALVTLRTARETPQLERIALYEPPLGVDGSLPLGWVPRYERELDAGKTAAALITGLKGNGTDPLFARVPRFALAPLMALAVRTQRPGGADEASIAELIPTLRYDMRLVAEMAGTAGDYAGLAADVLLLAGTRVPGYFGRALDELESVLPRSRRVTLAGLTHEGPEDEGQPLVVAGVLREFFSAQ